MKKISAEDTSVLLKDAADTIRALASERDAWRKVAQEHITEERISKLASSMRAKGMDSGVSSDELMETLRKVAEKNELDVVERAVDLAGPDMPTQLGKLASRSGDTVETPNTDANQSSALARFNNFILS